MGGRILACAVVAAAVLGGSATAALPGAPARAVITASPLGTVSETSATFEFEATSESALARFECRLDGAQWRTCTSPMTYDGLGGGRHRFEVRLWGPFADPTPDAREWTVATQTQIAPEPLPPPRVAPRAPEPPRDPRRRDASGCAFAQNRPGDVSRQRLERAVVCVVNRRRARRGLRRVIIRRPLAQAAAAHARDMVHRRYFAHTSATGANVADRARRSGYLAGTDWWTVGEVLAWSRPAATPLGTVRAWMRSRGHRRVLLTPSFRDIGVSVVLGTPQGGGGGATAVGVFGRRG